MQLFALDKHLKTVFADHAQKQLDYICLECQGVVRLRGGMHRHPHFYHLAPSAACRLSTKSMVHIQLQFYMYGLISSGDCVLEKRFPEINRVADVVWVSKKLIFEIQCSPISSAEVEQRNRDYASQGFQVVWILHDMRYNQRRISAAEQFLRNSPFYFTNMNSEGKGIIYDQFDMIEKGMRKNRLPALSVSLDKPMDMQQKVSDACIPKFITARLKLWPLFFSGDLIDLCSNTFDDKSKKYIADILLIEESYQQQAPHKTNQWFAKYIKRPYQLFFQMLLEKACK